MGKDYYKILGIDKSADDDAIKRAYKKKALLRAYYLFCCSCASPMY